jgi:excinuclease UvrABC nuclease subunit
MRAFKLSVPESYDANKMSGIEGHFVYLLLDGSDVVYVGKTNNAKSRVKFHRISGKAFDSIQFIECSKLDQRPLERVLIYGLNPKYNTQVTWPSQDDYSVSKKYLKQ